MSIIKSIKQVLGLSVTPSENYHWDGSVANKLTLKRGVPGAEGVTVLEADAAIAKFPVMPWADGAPVVERGSNANGDYTKFADGTVICVGSVGYSNITTTSGPIFRTQDNTWTLPITTFGSLSVSAQDNGAGTIWGAGRGGGSSASFILHFPTSLAGSRTARLLAIGRWKE